MRWHLRSARLRPVLPSAGLLLLRSWVLPVVALCWLASAVVHATTAVELALPYPPPSAASGELLPFISLTPTTLNYTRHFSLHHLDEALVFSSFSSSAPSSTVTSHLPLLLSLATPSRSPDSPPFTLHSLLFATCEDPSSYHCTHLACDPSHAHGLLLTPCPSLPTTLLPLSHPLSLRLSYRPTTTRLPSPLFLLLNTTAGLYSSALRVITPPTFRLYQRSSFDSNTSLLSAGLMAVAGRALVGAPLLLLLALAAGLLLAQTGFVRPEQVQQLLTTVHLASLQPLHRTLSPFLYPSYLSPPPRSAAPPPTANKQPPVPAATNGTSPTHILLRRRRIATTPSSSSTSSASSLASSTSSSPLAGSVVPSPHSGPHPSASLDHPHHRRHSLHSLPPLPFSSLVQSLDLTPLSLRHHHSLSLGTGESMLKEAERQLRRRKRKEKEEAGKVKGGAGGRDRGGRVGEDEVKGLDIASPPKARRTMSVGSSGPLFFRFDRIERERVDESDNSSEGSSDDSDHSPSDDSDGDSGDKDGSEHDRRARLQRRMTNEQQQRAVRAVDASPAKPDRDEEKAPSTPSASVVKSSAAPMTVPIPPSPQPPPSPSAAPPASLLPTEPNGRPALSSPRLALPALPAGFSHVHSVHAAQGHATGAPPGLHAHPSAGAPSHGSLLSASAPPYISPRVSSSSIPLLPNRGGVSGAGGGGGYPSHHSPRHSPFYSSPPYASNGSAPAPSVASPSSRSYASHSTRPSRPPGLPQSPVHSHHHQSPHAQHYLHPSLVAQQQQQERMLAQEKAQQQQQKKMVASFHPSQYATLQPQLHPQRYATEDIIVYDRSDVSAYHTSPASPVSRPALPQLVLPKSPDVGPAITPSSPQPLRTTLSPTARPFVGLAGPMRDGRWGGGAAGLTMVNELSDWPTPEQQQPPPHRRQLTPFHPAPTQSIGADAASSSSSSTSSSTSLFEIREEGDAHSPSILWSSVDARSSPSLLLSRSTPTAASSSPFFSSALTLPLPVDSWSTATTPSGPSSSSSTASSSMLRPALSSSTPSAAAGQVDDVDGATEEELLELQAMRQERDEEDWGRVMRAAGVE